MYDQFSNTVTFDVNPYQDFVGRLNDYLGQLTDIHLGSVEKNAIAISIVKELLALKELALDNDYVRLTYLKAVLGLSQAIGREEFKQLVKQLDTEEP